VEVVNLLILEAYSTSGTNPTLLGTIHGQMNEASLQFLPAAESVSKSYDHLLFHTTYNDYQLRFQKYEYLLLTFEIKMNYVMVYTVIE